MDAPELEDLYAELVRLREMVRTEQPVVEAIDTIRTRILKQLSAE